MKINIKYVSHIIFPLFPISVGKIPFINHPSVITIFIGGMVTIPNGVPTRAQRHASSDAPSGHLRIEPTAIDPLGKYVGTMEHILGWYMA